MEVNINEDINNTYNDKSFIDEDKINIDLEENCESNITI